MMAHALLISHIMENGLLKKPVIQFVNYNKECDICNREEIGPCVGKKKKSSPFSFDPDEERLVSKNSKKKFFVTFKNSALD